jgi:methyl-accepting chemotaxis protein
MDEMTQQNAALVEESSAASRAMSEEARNMNNMIGFFNMGRGGSSASFSSSPEPIVTYQSTPAAPTSSAPSSKNNKGTDGAASFSKKDEWEDF